MAYADTTTTQSHGFWAALARPFTATLNFLIVLGDSGSRMNAVRHLNAQTDAGLAAKGTTRSAEVNRIFAPYMYL